jgi:hypothetical protein
MKELFKKIDNDLHLLFPTLSFKGVNTKMIERIYDIDDIFVDKTDQVMMFITSKFLLNAKVDVKKQELVEVYLSLNFEEIREFFPKFEGEMDSNYRPYFSSDIYYENNKPLMKNNINHLYYCGAVYKKITEFGNYDIINRYANDIKARDRFYVKYYKENDYKNLNKVFTHLSNAIILQLEKINPFYTIFYCNHNENQFTFLEDKLPVRFLIPEIILNS